MASVALDQAEEVATLARDSLVPEPSLDSPEAVVGHGDGTARVRAEKRECLHACVVSLETSCARQSVDGRGITDVGGDANKRST